MKTLLNFFTILFVFTACEKYSAIHDPEPESEIGVLSIQMDSNSIPNNVDHISGMLFRSSSDTMFFDFVMNNQFATALVENIPADIWTIKVDAFNSNGDIIYTGTADIRIIPGQITPVHINLSQIGGIDIIVTWGNDDDDQFEENDRISEAAPLTEFTYYRNLIVYPFDEDWYSMSISADSLSIKCDFVHANGDINIDLVDRNGNVLATSQSTTDNERINYIVSGLDTYYIHVYLSSGTRNTYTIWWDDIWP